MNQVNSLFAATNDLINWIGINGDPSNARNLGGIVPAYPIFMFIGIIAVIVASIIKMKMKGIPLRELEIAIVITVPIGIIGGTIFGKAFIPGIVWYHVFVFWEPGMSLFGALALGTTAGFVWFYKRSKVTMISVWVYADCILPNILLGQAIGRWGNMYNHEILGKVVDYESLGWMVDSIRDRLFYFPSELANLDLPNNWGQIVYDHANNIDAAIEALVKAGLPTNQEGAMRKILADPIEYREPLFLYESMANSFLWLILIFGVANLSRFFQPRNKYPWDLDPKAYPGWYNKKYKHLPETEISSMSSQKAIKYKRVLVNKVDWELKLSFFNAWNKAYYWYEADEKETEQLVERQTKRIDSETKAYEKLDFLKEQKKKNQEQSKRRYLNKTKQYQKDSPQAKAALNAYKQEIAESKQNYQEAKREQYQVLGGFWRHSKPNPDARYLEKINNPHEFWILRCGVLSGGYVFGYMLLRIVLETHRQVNELFVQNSPVADFIVLSLVLLSGLVIILFAQFISPYKWREVGWLYEKSY